jgi:hypothetical protein
VFKRSHSVETPRMATAYDSAKEHIGPAIETAKESGAHALQAAMAAVVPVVAAAVPAMAAAKSKGADLLGSDAAHEARERAALMLAAAKGEAVSKKRRRWPLAMSFLALGSAIGAAVTTWLQRKAQIPSPYYAESGHAGPKVDLSKPLTETEPLPVTVLSDGADENSDGTDDDGERVDDYSDPKAAF